MKEMLIVNGVEYTFSEEFDTNLSLLYENETWDYWHIVREFISNALDSVQGEAKRVKVYQEDGFVHIADDGAGYPLVYAKRIGASSKKNDSKTIGFFGEGVKLSLLTCLRKGINVRLASQNWLIIPKVKTEEGIDVLVFEIYQSQEPMLGSIVSIEATTNVTSIVQDLPRYFLQFNEIAPLHGTAQAGIYPNVDNKGSVFVKGVYIRNIETLYSYALCLEELNRDRDVISMDVLGGKIRDIWESVHDAELVKNFLTTSNRLAMNNVSTDLLEYKYTIYLNSDCYESWRQTFSQLYGEKAVIYTDSLAAKEATLMGYTVVRFEYYAQRVLEQIGIRKDIDIVRADYEFTWSKNLTRFEQARILYFHRVAELLQTDCPKVRIYDRYAKSEQIQGLYNHEKDEIYIKRDILNAELAVALSTFIHELSHRISGAGDIDRAFADALGNIATERIIHYVNEVGLPTELHLSNRGFRLPRHIKLASAQTLATVALVRDEIVISVGDYRLRAKISGQLRTYCGTREVSLYKGVFYVNIPKSIREQLPEIIDCSIAEQLEQIA
jgi:hypothetical protein